MSRDKKFDEVKTKLSYYELTRNEKFNRVFTKLDEHLASRNERFDKVDSALESVDTKVDKLQKDSTLQLFHLKRECYYRDFSAQQDC